MKNIIFFVVFFLVIHNVEAKVHPCIELSRNANWLDVLLTCQDLAIDKDDPIAAYILGYMYQNNIYVSFDSAKSARWYKLAAVNGDSQAKFNLGIMYLRGQGVGKPNKDKGILLIKEAAKMGHISAISLINKIKNHDLINTSNNVYQLNDYIYILNDY